MVPVAWARARLVLAVLVLAACRDRNAPSPPREGPPPAWPGLDAAGPAPQASLGGPFALASAAPPPERLVRLPAADRLRAPFRGTNAAGFVAATAIGRAPGLHLRRVVPLGPAPDDLEGTPVVIASFTKLWVAVAVLRLVERGELSLDATVAELLPELASRPWSDSTLRELLTHTSRVPELEGAGIFSRRDVDFARPVEMLSRHVSRSATEKRGVYKYRNAELALCGAILEARAGVPAAQVLAREVFEPAGMTRSGLLVGEAPPAVDLRPLGALRPQNFFTAGAGYASPTDLLAFFEALAGPSLVSDASRKVLFDGAPERGHGAMGCWAYPFGAADAGTTLLVERPGAFGNVRLFSAFFPDERRAIVAWSREPVDIGRPRTPRSIGSALARVVLEADTAPVNPPR